MSVGLDGLATLIPMPLPDIDPDKPNFGLSDLGDDLLSLQNNLIDLQTQLQTATNRYNYYLSTGNPSASSYLGPVQDLTKQVNDLQKQINTTQAAQTATTAAQASVPAPAPTPGSTAQATRDYLAQYVNQMQLLKMGGFYDMGAGSANRNKIYAREGLGDLDMQPHESFDDCDSGLGDLGLDLFAAVQAAVKDKAVSAEFSKITSPFATTDSAGSVTSVGGNAVPTGVSAFFSGIFKAGKDVAGNIANQATAPKTVPSAGGQSTAQKKAASGAASASGMSSGTIIAIIAIAGVGVYAVTKKKGKR